MTLSLFQLEAIAKRIKPKSFLKGKRYAVVNFFDSENTGRWIKCAVLKSGVIFVLGTGIKKRPPTSDKEGKK